MLFRSILQGAFLKNPIATAVAGTGVILGAVYMLWLSQRILFGKPETTKSNELSDINFREFIYLLPLVILVFVMGLYPKPFMNKMEASINAFTVKIQNNKTVVAPVQNVSPAATEQ